MALLKLVKMRMTLSNLWDLAYLAHFIIKNGKRTSRDVKRYSLKPEERAYLVQRYDICIALNSLEAFTIYTLGLATAVDKLVHRYIFSSAKLLELLRLVV